MELATGRALAGVAARQPEAAHRWTRGRNVNTTRLIAVLAALAVWQSLASTGAVSSLFLSSPSAVARRLIDLAISGALWHHAAVSGLEAGLGLGLALAVGVPLGVAMGRSALVRDVLEPFVVAKYSAPTVAFLPLLIIWLGIGLWAKVALVFLAAVFVLIVSTEAGVATTEPRLIETARAMTASEWQITTTIIIPWALPFILAGLRLAIGRALIMVVVAEMYAATSGIGFLIFQGAAYYDATLVFAGVFVLSFVGVALNQILRAIERRVAPWRVNSD